MNIISEGFGRLHIDERLSAFDTCKLLWGPRGMSCFRKNPDSAQ